MLEIVKQYGVYSSVGATEEWLQANGFEECAFAFVRYNIPFYSLPLVNYFIVVDMGIVRCNELIAALERLRHSPTYNVKGTLCSCGFENSLTAPSACVLVT